MKLFYVPGACSLSVHITLREVGIPFELVKVDRLTKKTPDGTDYNTINTKGHVPAIQLDDGRVLTEAAVVLQYVADQKPASNLIPPPGQFERYRVQEWLNFLASDVHKGYSPLFNSAITPEAKEAATKNLIRRYDWIAKQIEGRTYLLGDKLTVADTYFFAITRWSDRVKFDLSPWPAVQQLMQRIAERPKVHEALVAEGLIS